MAGELIEEYGDALESITLVKSTKGRFDVSVDGELIYSKFKTKRHANPGEVIKSLREMRVKSANSG